jgi:stage V sporulation protein SpoVS
MKRRLFVLAVLGLALAAVLPAQKFIVAGTESVRPFAGLVTNVLKDAGFEPELQVMPMQRFTQALGESTVAGGFFLSEQAAKAVTGAVKIPVVLFKNEVVAFAVKPDVKITSNADLAKYKVGIVRGNATHEAVAKGITPLLADNEESEVKMLAAGRFDVAILARSLVAEYCKKAGIDKYYVQEPPVLITPLYFVLSAKNAGLEAKLNVAFKKQVDSGQWTKDINAVLAGLAK